MYDYPFTESENLVAKNLMDELLKKGMGAKRVKMIIPIQFINEIDIFSVIRLQDPYGEGAGDVGESGRLYYIIGLNYDFMGAKISVDAIDLHFFLEQCIILGDCTVLAPRWSEATLFDRMFGYLANSVTGKFSDGAICKHLCRTRGSSE